MLLECLSAYGQVCVLDGTVALFLKVLRLESSGHRQTRSTSAFIDKIIHSKQSLDEKNFLIPSRSVPGWGRTD